MAKSTVQTTEYEFEDADGVPQTGTQYRATIPKQLAEFFELEQGDELEWSTGSARNKIELTISKHD